MSTSGLHVGVPCFSITASSWFSETVACWVHLSRTLYDCVPEPICSPAEPHRPADRPPTNIPHYRARSAAAVPQSNLGDCLGVVIIRSVNCRS